MRAGTRVRRFMLLVVGLQVVVLAFVAPSAGAKSPLCTVRNLSTTTVYTGAGANLQTAINAASAGATLQIQGACVGQFTISNTLALVGKRSTKFAMPRLDGNGLGTVLTITAGTVSIKNVIITNGLSTTTLAAGIQSAGNLTLNGSTTVTGNSSGLSGFGGVESTGTLTMNGHASVRHDPGGGVGNLFGATFTMNGWSSVSHNDGVEGTYGGGIWNEGTVTLNGSASVVGNTTISIGFVAGGGIYSYGGHVTLNGSSQVTGNTTSGNGGGAYLDAGAILTMNDGSVISGDTANSGGGIFNQNGTIVGGVAGTNVSGNSPDDIAP